MSKTDDSGEITAADMMEKLNQIEKTVEEATGENNRMPDEARLSPDPGTQQYQTLVKISEQSPMSSAELNFEGDTRVLSRLYQSYLVNREKRGNVYHYTLSELGEQVVESGEQLQIDEAKTERDADPWDGTPINQAQYRALELVADSDEHPKATELRDEYREMGYQNKAAISSRLNELHTEGVIDRTPHQPYRYWVTDKGREILKE